MAATIAYAFEPFAQPDSASAGRRVPLNLVPSDPLAVAYRKQLVIPKGCSPALEAAVEHVLHAPGSLTRMRMAFLMAQAWGLPSTAALDAATSIEYFHTASLLLDDLPCMDHAAERRGVACTHLLFGEHQAILASLAFVNRAYALAWKVMAESSASTANQAAIYLENMLGLGGLLSGQSQDLTTEDSRAAGTATQVARQKTVALIRLALVWPALLAGAESRSIQRLERLAVGWGLAYQAADDLKDCLASSKDSGKTSARDQARHRPNLALEIGIDATLVRLKRLLAYGDRVYTALLSQNPALTFLLHLRSGLQQELVHLHHLNKAAKVETER